MKALVIIGAAAAAIACMPTAHADPDNGAFSGPRGDDDDDDDDAAYWVDLQGTLVGSEAKDGELGHQICRNLRNGMSEGDVIAALAQPPDPMPIGSARLVVDAAEWHYCPDKY